MAEADTRSSGQCKAVTEDGERCSRPAGDDGFCYQHDESDPTVSDSQTVEDGQEEQTEQSTEETRSRDLGADMTAERKTDPASIDADVDVEHEEIEGVLAVRRTVQSTASDLIGREFDAVSEIAPTDDGWRAIVEVVERRAVPDTQDIIGRYEIELDEDATVHGYRRLDRYRRGDTAAFE
ncbi:gas vesicle protein GvpO, halophile-type [Natronobacterium gregoryi]|uniref:Gas vesicle protein n=2 Tax=Natronobacterium gregoryi TaxID=44930 RepID=L0AMD9_NATGS|nr:gas vesicle protein [Natronobacterium gregoryi]AFZ74215.1 Gas vesicle synthesis protein GvpO [Natronobacterium gregoryi SP2]ELY63670.1 Gas vesicle synthesis family protein [Natronobacterium gregoryi SP2]PLK21997.1 gas vesicle protein [Natronobacterium gregoryi SP2]SFI51631.1 Gas vesicle synthesis protein GvpO [Natronobacterium gregoryi]